MIVYALKMVKIFKWDHKCIDPKLKCMINADKEKDYGFKLVFNTANNGRLLLVKDRKIISTIGTGGYVIVRKQNIGLGIAPYELIDKDKFKFLFEEVDIGGN